MLIFAVGARQQAAQQQITRIGLAQQQDAYGLVPIGLVADPDIAADDGLYALLARLLVKLDQPEQIGKISQGQRRHAIGHSLCHRLVDTHNAVYNGILAVQAQVDKWWRCGHGVARLTRGGEFSIAFQSNQFVRHPT